MIKWMGVAVLGLSLVFGTACGSKDKKLIAGAQEAVKKLLKDPGSAEFRSVSVVQMRTPEGPAAVVCGEFNAKNGFGGFAGFEPFAWHPDGTLLTKAAFPSTDEATLDGAIKEICAGNLVK